MKRVVIDCDNTMGLPFKEIDDGLTLLYLLGRPDIDLIGVTTIFGNGTTGQAYEQTKEILRRINRAIPVWRGQEAPGEGPNEAASFLARTAAEHPGKVSVLATGPLTNLQAALRIDNKFFENLDRIVCMGGYLEPLRIGWRSLSELNLSADPQSAYAVLNAPCPVILMSAQLCLQASFGWSDLKNIQSLDPWFRKTIRNWLLSFGLYFGVPRFYLWDLVPAVYLSYPDLFDPQQVSVISTVSDLAEGKVLVQKGRDAGRVTLPEKILDPDHFREIVYEGWRKATE